MTATAAALLTLRQPAGEHPDATAGRVAFKAKSLADAVEYAYEQLAIADDVNFGDPASIARSQGGLAATLRRLLWVLDEAEDSRDRAADVPNEVAVEDAVAADEEKSSRYQWADAA
ncbi:hypothetical protein [Streptomyces microflavus]|uniref:hypothetical protein n=1 Tax=Streptomyces microflavus TaxID=1919 RepID=UPI002E33C660|nr:hypothetical protein [Streptomyces microflavus]